MDQKEIDFDTETGEVRITQTTRGGVALVPPVVVTVSVDGWLSVACMLIQGQIQDRQKVQPAAPQRLALS